jgi:hypothetical protein
MTHLDAPIRAFFSQPFLTVADVFIPARPRNLGLTFITTTSGTGGLDVVTVPNWPSTTDRSTIQVNDFVDGLASTRVPARPP